jgi:hypothetical protein
MPPGRYYKQRHSPDGKPPQLSLTKVGHMVAALYRRAREAQWFDELFGKDCVDDRDGREQGVAGSDPAGFIFGKTWVENALPLAARLENCSDEDTLFTLIEFLFDYVSFGVPAEGPSDWRDNSVSWHHDHDACGWHYRRFTKAPAQETWRREINEIIQYFGDGFELTAEGQVERVAGAPGLKELLETPLPPKADEKLVVEKVEHARQKFRSRHSNLKERQEAVRELADVLEVLRPRVKEHLLNDDEKALYLIANNYQIRHHNKNQKTAYRGAWLSWIFHMYLATIHLLSHLEDPPEATKKK